ncbi:hypothetical protein EAI90_14965 [Faecalibacterium prausnitzii]|nr:hypothetical protein [Faecalibacterium prausnitzii]RGE18091.1 hypothetical protein DXA87_00010 [Desulfotomaculum sp. OF05-3]MSC72548.1 hypothetical protein [Faecalibacterium prausnitzii]MSC96738.1 hypothetical protein [Faecalibacterium prausnitzii]MSD51894.1 hypothetical protein [Faecalibacterium prausnitzii]
MEYENRTVYRNTEIKTILFISYPFLSYLRYFLRDFPVEKSRKGTEWGKEQNGTTRNFAV